MPDQVDLETPESACARGATARETVAEGGAEDDTPKNGAVSYDYDAADLEPDFPPESFWLSKDAEYDWFDRNAFYERKDSTKGNFNSAGINPGSNSNSQRYSVGLKSKAAIIGLPKTQKTTFVDSKRRTCKPVNVKLFPKRSDSAGKSTATLAEPGSPKVSCIGRVRSKRCRRRSNSLRRKEKPMDKSRSGGEKQKAGFYSKVMSMFRSKKGRKKPSRSASRKVVEVLEEEQVVVELRRRSLSVKVREIPTGGETAAEPPSLGGVKRFASGRRSDSWSADDFILASKGLGDTDRGVGAVSGS